MVVAVVVVMVPRCCLGNVALAWSGGDSARLGFMSHHLTAGAVSADLVAGPGAMVRRFGWLFVSHSKDFGGLTCSV